MSFGSTQHTSIGEKRHVARDAAEVDYELPKSIKRAANQAIVDFELIRCGDRVAVGVSGGKDSILLAALLMQFARREDMDFEVHAVHLDQGQPGFDHQGLRRALSMLAIPLTIIERDTHSVVQEHLKPGQIPCSICSRLRRGILNAYCAEQGYTKLALGHHLNDAVETFFLNLFFQRRLEELKPLTPTSLPNLSVIRPLILVEERKIQDWIERSVIPTVACPVCDTFPDSKRRDLKRALEVLREIQPQLLESVRAALYGR